VYKYFSKLKEFNKSLAARLLLVLTAFILMVMSSSFIMFRTLNSKNLRSTNEIMNDTALIVSQLLNEPKIVLNFIANHIEAMYKRGEELSAIKNYMTECSTFRFRESINIANYNSVYGYFINAGEFHDGAGWQPNDDYTPGTRPWFGAALAANGQIAITSPYIATDTQVLEIAYARLIFGADGNPAGIICINYQIGHLKDLIINKSVTPNGYGFMLDGDYKVIIHPDDAIKGETINKENPAPGLLMFSRQLDNGWHLIIVIPEKEYYKELYEMILFISILAAILAATLIIILVRLEAAKRGLRAADRAKSSFLAAMSHEIRTPMNAILGITEIYLQNETLGQDIRGGLEKIYMSGDMLLGIINDILDLSKIEAGKLEMITANYEVASLISDTVQLNMMRIGSKPIEFGLEVDENLPAILVGDELRVKQILNNLLSNGFKYTAAGAVTLSVTAETADSEGKIILLIDVSDTGQGMNKEQVEKLFDEYSRFNTETNRSTEGIGLGLSITRNLIHTMGGTISVTSEPNKGSVFTVRLPQGKAGSEVLGKEMADNLHNFRTSSRAQMKRVQITREPMPYGKVLIVDDVETNIFVAKGLLKPYELKIESAESGFAAIEKIKGGNVYDIIFMDHMMPEMDGVEATKIIREMGYTEPVVALTANAVAGQAEIFLGNGFNDFISKPIDIRRLNLALNKLIRDKQPPEVIEAARNQAGLRSEQTADDKLHPSANPKIAESFIRDAKKSLAALNVIMDKGIPLSDESMWSYIIHTHGMKSALANMARMDLSAIALKLEQSGRDKNSKVIAAETPNFINLLSTYVDELLPPDKISTEINTNVDMSFIAERLHEIKAACGEYDERAAAKALAEIKAASWPQGTELLDTITEKLLHSDFEEITGIIDEYTNNK